MILQSNHRPEIRESFYPVIGDLSFYFIFLTFIFVTKTAYTVATDTNIFDIFNKSLIVYQWSFSYSTFCLLDSFVLHDMSSLNEEMDLKELIDFLFASSILPKRLAHSLLETSESCKNPQDIIITEMTQSAVCLEIASVETTAIATATLTMMLGTVMMEPRDSGGM